MKIANTNKLATGIDIGSSSIRAVEVRNEGGKYSLAAYAEIRIDNMNRITPESLSVLIAKMLENPVLGNFTSQYVNVSLPRSIAHNHFLVLNTKDTAPIDKSIQHFMMSKLKIDTKSHYFDYYMIGSGLIEQSKDVYIIEILEKKFFNDFVSHLSSRGLLINSIVPTFAKQLSDISCQTKESPKILIDMGYSQTKLFFLSKLGCVEKRLDFGGINITNQISSKLHVSEQKALELQSKVGFVGSDLANTIARSVTNDIEHYKSSIIEFVRECANVFGVEDMSKIDIYFTGSSLGTRGILDILNDSNAPKMTSIDPWSRVGLYPLKPIPRHRLPKFSGAISLAC